MDKIACYAPDALERHNLKLIIQHGLPCLIGADNQLPGLYAAVLVGFGDNDTLSAEVAALVDADLLIIFSDIDGLYDCDPRENPNAKIIPRVSEITDDIHSLAGGAGSKLGTGGMVTKIHAAEVCFENDVPMVITNGVKLESVYDILAGSVPGTLFMKEEK